MKTAEAQRTQRLRREEAHGGLKTSEHPLILDGKIYLLVPYWCLI